MNVHCSTFCSAPASQDSKTSKIKNGLQPIPFMVRCAINRVIHQKFISMTKWALSLGSGKPREISTCLLFITGRCLTKARYRLCYSEQSSQKIRWMCWATKLMLGQETEQMSQFIKGGFVSWYEERGNSLIWGVFRVDEQLLQESLLQHKQKNLLVLQNLGTSVTVQHKEQAGTNWLYSR